MTNPSEANLSTPRLQFIDGLRGIAVAMVVIFHAVVWGGFPVEGPRGYYMFDGELPIELGSLRHVLSVGGGGVDLFLAISGFCLFWPLVRGGSATAKKLEVAQYFKRRVRRICPPYYFGLASVFLCSYLTYRYQGPSWWPWAPNSFQNAFPWNGTDSWLNLTSHLLLIHGFFNNYIASYEGAYWSLSLEWQFYFLFVPLAYLAHKKGILWAVAMPIVTTLIFRLVCSQFFPDFMNSAVGHLFSLSRWAEFGAGMLAAAMVSGSISQSISERLAPLKFLRPLYLILSVLLALALEYSQSGSHYAVFAWGNASLALITVGAQHDSWLRKVMDWKPLVWLGTISYSLYLTHGMVYMAMALILSRTAVSRDIRQLIYLLLGPWIATAFAAIFFQLFERPFLNRVVLKRQSDGHLTAENKATVQDQAIP